MRKIAQIINKNVIIIGDIEVKKSASILIIALLAKHKGQLRHHPLPHQNH